MINYKQIQNNYCKFKMPDKVKNIFSPSERQCQRHPFDYLKFRRNTLLVFLVSFFFFYFKASEQSFAQNRKIDSLQKVLKTEIDDTNKVNTLNRISYLFATINPDSTIKIGKLAADLSIKIKWRIGEGTADDNISIGLRKKADYSDALNYGLKALQIMEDANCLSGKAAVYGNLGNIYNNMNDNFKALDYDLKALKLAQVLKDKRMEAAATTNLGSIYQNIGDNDKALEADFKSLKLANELGNKNYEAAILGNIGTLFFDEQNYSKALEYSNKALQIAAENDNKSVQTNSLLFIGLSYYYQGELSKALEYYQKALLIASSVGNKSAITVILGNIGAVYGEQKNYSVAINYFNQALNIAREINARDAMAFMYNNIGEYDLKFGKVKEAEDFMKKAIYIDNALGEQNHLWKFENDISGLYDSLGRYKLALYWYKKATVLKDTLYSNDNEKAITRRELSYKFERQSDSTKALQDKKDAIVEQDRKKQSIIRNSFIGGFVLSLTLAFFIFRGYRQKQRDNLVITRQKLEVERQKLIVEQQKELVEEKNKDILDSIIYAKRLQDAILPPPSLIRKYFPESFVLYKPKDIVAGDFYWIAPLPLSAGEGALIAAADCTGHGVPGAMVSVVCSNALNRAVKEFHITDPGKILDKTRELVLETFEKSEGNIQDGMDISLASLSRSNGGMTVQWAGAYNPLLYFPCSEGMWGTVEIPADKQPIGSSDNPAPFTTHTFEIPIMEGGNTCIYLFTDGFADQFGGAKGKKLKYRQMQELFLANAHKSMKEQKLILENSLKQWMGSLEQVDDILIIGIKV